jgi:hypothetical protein
MVYMHITFKHCCDFISKCKMGDIIGMQNIGGACMDVANMDEIFRPIVVEIRSCGWPQRNMN